MKKILFLLLFSAVCVFPAYAKGKSYSSLSIVEQIEKNLLHSQDVEKKAPEAPIVIQKGTWTKKETEGFEAVSQSKVQASISESTDDERAIALKRKAYDAIQIGQTEVAIKLYKQILKENKNDNYAKLSLAVAYHQLGQYKQAKPLYMEMLEKFPNDEQIIANLLSIVIEETPHEAIYLLSALSDKNPNSPLIHAQASVAYGNVKDYTNAIKYIKKAIALDKKNLQYNYNLAVLYDMNEEYRKAYSIYKDVLLEARRTDTMNQIPFKQIQDRMSTIENYQ